MSRGVGIHGVGMQRDVGVVLEGGTPAWVNANNDAVCALMIEKKQAVDDLEQLLSVPGVDMVCQLCLPRDGSNCTATHISQRGMLFIMVVLGQVQFGATDYSVSIGHPGQDGRPGTTRHPKGNLCIFVRLSWVLTSLHHVVDEAEMKVIKTAQRMGIAVRIEGSSATVQKYKDLVNEITESRFALYPI